MFSRIGQIGSIALLAAAVALTLGCAKSGGSSNIPKIEGKVSQDVVQGVIDNISDNVIVANYTDLSDKTSLLVQATQTLQRAPTQANLDAAQAAWKAARVPWESSEGFLFGPVEALGVDPHIDSWPLSKVDLDKILRENSNITPSFVHALGTDVQGYHTIEYLLFGDGVTTNTKMIRDMSASQLAYLAACTQVLNDYIEGLRVAWTNHYDPENGGSPSYVSLIKSPSQNNRLYPSQTSVLQEFVNGIHAIASEVGKNKLSNPLGGNTGSADPSQVESQFSWNSLTDFQNNIRSIEYVYTGDYNGHQGPGLDVLVEAVNPALHAKILAQIQTAIDQIAAIAGPEQISFSRAILNGAGRDRVHAAIGSLSDLETTLRLELLPMVQ